MSASLIEAGSGNRRRKGHRATKQRRVRFQYYSPDAKEVFLAGGFNNWRADSTAMIRLDSGMWAKDLLLDPGDHEYRFVVDGEWTSDPMAAESVQNPFGTTNSRISVSQATPEL